MNIWFCIMNPAKMMTAVEPGDALNAISGAIYHS